MAPIPGGSGLNTATHLSSLVRDFSPFPESEEFLDVMLQTSINEGDEYGRVLMSHAKEHNFDLLNCKRKKAGKKQDGKKEGEEKSKVVMVEQPASTAHCIVIVADGERSFISHLGVMETFKASDTMLHELVNCRSANPTFKNHHHHIHIAGYFNMPGFSNGNLKRRLQKIREKRRCNSHGLNTYTTTTSLVPQYDATEKWDSGILDDLLPLVDFLILNALEAGKISKIPIDELDGGNDLNRAVVFTQLADFFWTKSPQTYVIVTLGKAGALAMYEGEIIASIHSPKVYNSPLDPTGAGDAFAAGFLYGITSWRQQRNHDTCAEIGSYLEGSWTEAIIEGLKYGSAAGTACVMTPGASVPASKEKIEKLMNGDVSDDDDDDEEGEEDGTNGDARSEESYDSEYESSYYDDSDYDSDYYSRSDEYSENGGDDPVMDGNNVEEKKDVE